MFSRCHGKPEGRGNLFTMASLPVQAGSFIGKKQI